MMHTFKKVWRMPLLLDSITLFGLLAALLGTGFWYVLAWVALSSPLLIIIRKSFFQNG